MREVFKQNTKSIEFYIRNMKSNSIVCVKKIFILLKLIVFFDFFISFYLKINGIIH